MAVYTHITKAHLDEVAQLYGFRAITEAIPITEGVENTNYLLHYQDAESVAHRAILTLFEQRVSRMDIPFFMRLTQHLKHSGISCPAPYITTDGQLFCKIAGKSAVCVTFLEGKSVTLITPDHAAQAGKVLAQMHQAAQCFAMTRPNAMSFTGWHGLRDRIAAHYDGALLPLIDDALRAAHEAWRYDIPSGIIHADYFPNNVFFNASGTLCGVIDFYFACHDAFAYDLAIAANAWCFEHGVWQQAHYDAMVAAYDAVRPLQDAERAMMPALLRAAALRFLLTRLHDVLYPAQDALIVPHDPQDYVTILRFHQQQAIASS